MNSKDNNKKLDNYLVRAQLEDMREEEDQEELEEKPRREPDNPFLRGEIF